MRPSPVTLGPDLEIAVLAAIASGSVPPDSVTPAELPSKEGRSVLAALQRVVKSGTKTPVSLRSVVAAATDVDGAERKGIARLCTRLASILSKGSGPGSEVGELVQVVRDKKLLQRLINDAGAQLAAGSLDVGSLAGLLAVERKGAGKLQSASELVANGVPPEPSGLSLKEWFPRIHSATGGLFGLWAIGGEPGLGKTTLCWQLALIAARTIPVLYYDLDGTGEGALLRWTWDICQGSRRKAGAALSRVHLRDSIRTLDADLGTLGGSGLVVCDSFQTLPTLTNHRRNSLDDWLTRFKGIVKQGHTVLLVSEKNRASYGRAAGLADFKETAELEYAVSMGAHLTGDPLDEDEPIAFSIVKNRHRRTKGRVTELVRDEKRGGHWFREI